MRYNGDVWKQTNCGFSGLPGLRPPRSQLTGLTTQRNETDFPIKPKNMMAVVVVG